MMMESDGVEEALGGQVRVAVQAASQLAESVSRVLNDAKRERLRQAETERRDAEARYRSQLETARFAVRDVHRSEWWDKASAEDIGDVYRVAHTWKDHDSEMAKAHASMSVELRQRYGIDVRDPQADPQLVGHEIARQQHLASREYAEAAALNAQANRVEAEASQDARDESERGDGTDPLAELQQDVLGDDAAPSSGVSEREASHDKPASELEWDGDVARNDASVAYDSAERRTATVAAMKQAGVSDANVEVRMNADRSYAAPAREATRTRGATNKARKATRTGARNQQQSLGR